MTSLWFWLALGLGLWFLRICVQIINAHCRQLAVARHVN
jgi:hypothetical protein